MYLIQVNSFVAEVPRNQLIELLCKFMDWFLHDRDLHHERLTVNKKIKKRVNHRNHIICLNKNIVTFGIVFVPPFCRGVEPPTTFSKKKKWVGGGWGGGRA